MAAPIETRCPKGKFLKRAIILQVPNDVTGADVKGAPTHKVFKNADGSPDEYGLTRRCLSDVLYNHMEKTSKYYSSDIQKYKESKRMMKTLQFALMDRLLERRSETFVMDHTVEPACSFYVDEVIEWNNMMANFEIKEKEKPKKVPSLFQLASAKVRKTPELICQPLKVKSFELIKPAFFNCNVDQRLRFIKNNMRFVDETDKYFQSTAATFKSSRKVLPNYSHWYQYCKFLWEKNAKLKEAPKKVKPVEAPKKLKQLEAPKRKSSKKEEEPKQTTSVQSLKRPLAYDPREASVIPKRMRKAPIEATLRKHYTPH